MIENKLDDIEDVQALIRWMQAPANRKPVLPFNAEPYLQRLQLADTWLRTYFSPSKVWPMMLSHYKAQNVEYSQATARRDVEDAQLLFEGLSTHKRKYWTDLMLDKIGEGILSAMTAHKHNEAAKLFTVFLNYMRYADECDVPGSEQLMAPVPRQILFDPTALGIERNPNALEDAKVFIQQLKQQRNAGLNRVVDAVIVRDGAGDNP